MPRPVALLCLLLALTGQPLRQAEAATDLGRILAHLATAGSEVEIPDGGVGDDSGETLTKADTGHSTPAWCPSPSDFWTEALAPLPLFSVVLAPGSGPSRGHPGQSAWLPIAAGRRHAWLQLLQV